MIMSGMGELHLQVYAERIRREYDIDVEVGTPQVNYRESIVEAGGFNYLHKKQSGGSGQFARVVGRIEPLIDDFATCKDKSNMFQDVTGGQNIPHEYIPAIEKAFHECCKRGPLTGSPVIGVKYVLEDGQTHPVDSSSLAFSIATKYSMTEAFKNCSSVLLEPVMDVEVSGPAEFQAGIMNTISKRKGNIYDMKTQNDTFVCYAEVSLSNMFGYATELRGITQGVGEFSMEYKFHLPVPAHELDAILDKRNREMDSGKKNDSKKKGF
jgi:elongation factor G